MSEGKRIGSYVLERPIGSGGMGEVWLGHHELLGRPTVLKKLRKELASIDEVVVRFEREARTAASLHERQIVSVYDAFRFRGELYIAQEYVEGADLRSILDRIEHLPPRLAAFVAIEVARALEAIHAAGTVHRDLKPSNLLISREGDVKVADFGIALERTGPDLTQLGAVIGTPTYMSPEQLCGERADTRSDLFAFGALLYEMLTGRVPYADTELTPRAKSPALAQGESERSPTAAVQAEPADERPASPTSRLARMQKERYPAPRSLRKEIPRRLARLTRACLRTRPTRRPASATALRAALESLYPTPDPNALRAELAAHLWERGVFVRRETETVVRIAAAPLVRPRARVGSRAAIAVGGVLLALLTLGVIATRPVDSLPSWLDAVLADLGPLVGMTPRDR